MRSPWNYFAALFAAVAIVTVAGLQAPGPSPATTTTTTTTIPATENACEVLNGAEQGETITLVRAEFPLGDLYSAKSAEVCKVKPAADGVTVTGTWSGDVQCHGCDGWVFDGLAVAPGSLRMIGGCDWTISNSWFDGGDRGLMAVVGTGSLEDRSLSECKTSQRWRIASVTAEGAGCRPAGDRYPTHVRALYVIGDNGVDMDAVITGSTFRGRACGYTVKLGSTHNFGYGNRAPDAADGVTFTGNRVVVTDEDLGGAPVQAVPLLLSDAGEALVLDNLFECERAEGCAEVISNAYPQPGQRVEGNELVGEFSRFMLVTRPPANWVESLNEALYRTRYFVTITELNNCWPWATCEGNA